MRRFYLYRLRDVSGISGKGRVADGVLWEDGTVTVRWRSDMPSTVNWECMDHVEKIHGHAGATLIVWIDPENDSVLTEDNDWH